eukprot:XP_013997199.1 PREDICTED: vacuolar protein sorting-associated protein 52 homolog isoform X1 [Salmo salar]
MVEGAVTVAVFDVNIAGNSTANVMSYLQDEMQPDTDAMAPLNLGELDLTTNEFILDEVDIHIQANLEDDLVKEALKTGVDLRHYSKQVEGELQRIEQASIKDYIKESQNIASLHNQITACDSILERMEGMLSGFQSDLSSISSEIQTLQQQSVSMNVRLKNRQAVRSHLSQLVDELVVPGAMIQVIVDSPVTEQEFLDQLHELNNKINFAKELSFKETLACSDVQDIVCDTTIPSARFFWSNICGDIQWGKAWKIVNKYCISNKVKEVSFKMLHGIYPVKHVLERFKLNIDYNCDFCGME